MILRQRGLSLVELMVGLLLASIISLIAMSLLWQQQQAWRHHLARQQVQEEGHLVMRLLQDEAAYAGASLNIEMQPFFHQAPVHANTNHEHSVLNFYSHDTTDCLGRNLEAPEAVINQYYVRANGEGLQALYCRAFARGTWEEVELVRGVELFQARVLAELADHHFIYFKPEAIPLEVKVHLLEVLLVLRHTEVEVRAPGVWLFTDPWGEEWPLDKAGVHGRFFMRKELLNG